MSCIKHILLVSSFLSFTQATSQNDFQSLGETSFALNFRASRNYKMNFGLRYRYFVLKNDQLNFESRQLDFVHFSTFSLNHNNSLSAGIQYRNRTLIDGGSDELRFTEQFNHVKRNHSLRFGHRIRFEQRFLQDLTIFRSRYRFAIDFPLNGEKLDVNESYVIISMEGLLSNSKRLKPELGHRTTSQIGWLISERSKIQFGLEYRLEAINIQTMHLFFITSSFIYSL